MLEQGWVLTVRVATGAARVDISLNQTNHSVLAESFSKIRERSHFVGENVKLRGYIDEVRISNVVRYVGPEWEVPEGKFKVDKHTISLWHFDEAPGLSRFKNASGNGHHLWRSGVIGGLAVETQGKLTTTWGQLKQ